MAGYKFHLQIMDLFGFLLLFQASVVELRSVSKHQPPQTFDCPVNLTTSQSSRCDCLPTMDILCTNLDHIPMFTQSDNVFAGIYMNNQDIHEIPAHIFYNLKVQKIVLDYNPIQSNISRNAFTFKDPHLVMLSLGGCGIEVLPSHMLKGLDTLKYLYLWNNKIRSIPRKFFKSKKLRKINLKGNQIQSLDDGAFRGLQKLRKLNLDRNNITQLTRECFKGLVQLKELYLSHNELQSIYPHTFIYLTNLQTLKLNGNNIGYIYDEVFFGLDNLQSLWLRNNQISYIPSYLFSSQGNLVSLHLEDNYLQHLWPHTFQHLASLEILYLSGNIISSFTDQIFEPLPALKQLYLDQNPFQHLQKCVFSRMTNLTTLSLVNTSIVCDCQASWMADLSEHGTTVRGTCKAHPFSVETMSIADPNLYLLCSSDAKACQD